MKAYIKSLTVLLLLIPVSVSAFTTRPKRIREKGDYHHSITGTLFPVSFDGYTREAIFTFDRENTNICANYNSTDGNIRVSVYVYPARVAMEDRFRREYINALGAVATNIHFPIQAESKPVRVEKDAYKVLGMSGYFITPTLNSSLTLFECGKYFLKYRVSADNIDSSGMNAIIKKLTEVFSPIDIVKAAPLKIRATVHVAPGVIDDTVLLDPVLAAVKAKLEWVHNNVDSLERCAGFPGLYLEEQVAAVSAMLDTWKNIKHTADQEKERDFIELMAIRNSGFLNEYLFMNYNGLLYCPPNIVLRLKHYEKWEEINNPQVSISGPTFRYLLGYEQSYK